MRISVKGRYALASIMQIARSSQDGENIAVNSIAGSLGISKIYLEQVFTLLKKDGLLLSVKGSRGGYQLARSPGKITAWDILSVVEAALVEPTEATVEDDSADIEMAMQTLVFAPLDNTLRGFLSTVTVQDLLDFSDKQRAEQAFMQNM